MGSWILGGEYWGEKLGPQNNTGWQTPGVCSGDIMDQFDFLLDVSDAMDIPNILFIYIL